MFNKNNSQKLLSKEETLKVTTDIIVETLAKVLKAPQNPLTKQDIISFGNQQTEELYKKVEELFTDYHKKYITASENPDTTQSIKDINQSISIIEERTKHVETLLDLLLKTLADYANIRIENFPKQYENEPKQPPKRNIKRGKKLMSLEEKLKILKEVEATSVKEVMEKYNIEKKQDISDWRYQVKKAGLFH